MLIRLMLLISILMLTACSSMPNLMREQLVSLPQKYSQFDVKMAWEIKAVAGHTVIDGVVQNVRYATMEDLEIWALSFDANGKMTGRSVVYIVPSKLGQDEIASFGIKLPVLAGPGTRLRFTYSYTGYDGGNDGGGIKWMQSFESTAPVGAGRSR